MAEDTDSESKTAIFQNTPSHLIMTQQAWPLMLFIHIKPDVSFPRYQMQETPLPSQITITRVTRQLFRT